MTDADHDSLRSSSDSSLAPDSSEMTSRPDFFWYDGMWAHERPNGRGITPDPGTTFGRLANGLRWAAIPNSLPKGHVSLRLDVQAGSFMETAEEGGYAHIIEHMAFRGTARFGPGEVEESLLARGASFGWDVNAYTSMEATVYMIDLPSAEKEALRHALTVLRDFADAIAFDPDELEAEKAVILEEMRARDNESAQSHLAWKTLLYGESPLVRGPIGREETVRGATSASLRRFYEKWYRADRMIVVAAGDTGADVLEPLIGEIFGSLAVPASPLPFPSVKVRRHERETFMVQKRPMDSATVEVRTLRPRHYERSLQETAVRTVVEALARACMNYRMGSRADEICHWTAAEFIGSWIEGPFPQSILTARCSGGRWREALADLLEERDAALAWGITQEEVDRAVRGMEQSMLTRLNDEKLRYSGAIAADFVSRANSDEIWCLETERLGELERMRSRLTAETIDRALQNAFDGDVAVLVSGGVEAAEADLSGLYHELICRKPARFTELDSVDMPYLPLPDMPAELPELEKVEVPVPCGTMTVLETVLPGGVGLTLVPMPDKRPGVVSAAVAFGRGAAFMTDSEAETADFASAVLEERGPGLLTWQDWNRLYAGRDMGVNESLDDWSASVSGWAPRENAADLVTLLWTQYTDPLPESGAEHRFSHLQERCALVQSRVRKTVSGVHSSLYDPFFYGAAFREVDADVAADISLEQVAAYARDSRAMGIQRIQVSGDFDTDEMLALVTRLFGSCPAMRTDARQRTRQCVFPEGQSKTVFVEGERINKAIVSLAWRADFRWEDAHVLAARNLFTDVLSERLRHLIRGEMGAAYVPVAQCHSLEAYEGYGIVHMQVVTSRERMQEARDAMAGLAREFAEKGVDSAELERLRRPLMEAWKAGAGDGLHLCSLLLLDRMSGLPIMNFMARQGDEIATVTAEEVSALAREYLSDEPACLMVEGGPLGGPTEEEQGGDAGEDIL
ncbi:MAG: insulinase family protein [Desulfovibrionaceae bacterium]|nr:insulinase family protein [Desulfovibrionaceae bacterium]